MLRVYVSLICQLETKLVNLADCLDPCTFWVTEIATSSPRSEFLRDSGSSNFCTSCYSSVPSVRLNPSPSHRVFYGGDGTSLLSCLLLHVVKITRSYSSLRAKHLEMNSLGPLGVDLSSIIVYSCITLLTSNAIPS